MFLKIKLHLMGFTVYKVTDLLIPAIGLEWNLSLGVVGYLFPHGFGPL